MRPKFLKFFLLLVLISVLLFTSCSTRRGCSGMSYHNNDVRRGLAH